jgi:hypothetical protein
MIVRRLFLAVAMLAGAAMPASAQELRVVDSAPKAHATIGARSSGFYVRFNRPVDHQDSRLAIVRNGQVIEVLHPRLESSPDVLFARAPTLPPGSATRWPGGSAAIRSSMARSRSRSIRRAERQTLGRVAAMRRSRAIVSCTTSGPSICSGMRANRAWVST